MKMQKNAKKFMALLLAGAVIFSSINFGVSEAAAAKLSKKKMTIGVKQTVTLKIKGAKKVKWSTNKKAVVKLSAKKSKSVKITGKKDGKANVTAKFKSGNKTKKLTCKVTVSSKVIVDNNATAVPVPTEAVATSTPLPTAEPTPTPIPTPVPSPSVVSANGTWKYIPFDNDSLLKEFEPIFGNVGTCLTYKGVFGKNEMQDKDTMEFVKNNYNSYTLENELKPSYMLADADADFRNPPFNKLLTVSAAKEAGYTISDDYKEAYVPSINFDRLDTILKVSAEYGIRMRGHTLIWHSQTPMAFFKQNYDANAGFVSADVMDQRVIYYVTNVMKHVLESPYADVIYAWDVVNEYFHQSLGSDGNWAMVYNINNNGRLSTRPSFVKLSFKTAYDVLKEYGKTEEVALFYNDYNTSQVSNEIVEMINYINQKDSLNPEGERICNGVGMQCHLDVKWPSVNEQLGTVKKFIDAGFEVQVTELDIINSINEGDEETLCDYWYNFMKGLVTYKKEGGNITGVTFWGLSDAVTWRFGKSALLYGQSINDPKKSLYAVFAAAQTYNDLDKLDF